MAHHKRGRPKNRRAGCPMCKPWKANGCKRNKNNRTRQHKRAHAPDVARHRAKKKRKPYALEARYIGRFTFVSRKWFTWGRYASRRDRDKALRCLRAKPYTGDTYQFRCPESASGWQSDHPSPHRPT